jgi:hypothetical protein
MSINRAILSLSLGLFLAVIVIGLLPFLAVFSWAETMGSSELYTSPIFFINFLYKDDWMNHRTTKRSSD